MLIHAWYSISPSTSIYPSMYKHVYKGCRQWLKLFFCLKRCIYIYVEYSISISQRRKKSLWKNRNTKRYRRNHTYITLISSHHSDATSSYFHITSYSSHHMTHVTTVLRLHHVHFYHTVSCLREIHQTQVTTYRTLITSYYTFISHHIHVTP